MGLYGGRGDASPKKLLGGRKRKRPPTIATFSEQKLDFSILTTILVYCIFPYCTTKHLFHFISMHAESEEYTILAQEGVVALVANAKLNQTS